MTRRQHALPLPLLLLILVTACATSRSQSILIETLGGERYVGERLEETPDSVVIRSAAGVAVTVPRARIRTIDYTHEPGEKGDGRGGNGFWMFGMTYGTPGMLNVVVGRHFTRSVGLRISGGGMGDYTGLAFDGVFRLGSSGPLDHMIIAGMGTIEIDDGFDFRDWTYFQGGYNINVYGVNAFLALSAGWGSFDSPQATFQIGYVHRFL